MNDPQFVVGGFGRCDMDQGYIGNCWYVNYLSSFLPNEILHVNIYFKRFITSKT